MFCKPGLSGKQHGKVLNKMFSKLEDFERVHCSCGIFYVFTRVTSILIGNLHVCSPIIPHVYNRERGNGK